jgi:hypothetical protein
MVTSTAVTAAISFVNAWLGHPEVLATLNSREP